MKENKDNFRNTAEGYIIPLDFTGLLHADTLKKHIDSETLQFKQWPVTSLIPVTVKPNSTEYNNTSGPLSFILGITFSDNSVKVSCNCDRRVKMLCHHAYNAMRYLVITGGERYFLELKQTLIKN